MSKHDAKAYCHRQDCKPVETGFTTTFYSCKSCKSEITESLYISEKERIKRGEEKNNNLDNYDEDSYLGITGWNSDYMGES